jgi:phytol kinase
MSLVLVILLFLVLFVVVERGGAHFEIKPETTRQVVHIASGAFSALLPFVISFNEIALLGAIFAIFMAISKWQNLFKSIHAVKRKTWGEIYFPLAGGATALVFPALLPYIYAILVMGVGDGVASMIGQTTNRGSYHLFSPNVKKTFAGSAAFFVSVFLLGITIGSVAALPLGQAFVFSLASSAVLTLVEALLGSGLDNLALPLLAALMFSAAVG